MTIPDKPTGRVRRRSRRLPVLVYELEPGGIELFDFDGDERPLYGPQRPEPEPSGTTTADGEHRGQPKPMPSPADLARLRCVPGWVEATTAPVPPKRYVRPPEVDELLAWTPPSWP